MYPNICKPRKVKTRKLLETFQRNSGFGRFPTSKLITENSNFSNIKIFEGRYYALDIAPMKRSRAN